MEEKIKTHPVQVPNKHQRSRVPQAVSLKAYEVYRVVFGPQEALITGECRGGFSVGELIAFLYAHNFPAQEWRGKIDEALRGMENL